MESVLQRRDGYWALTLTGSPSFREMLEEVDRIAVESRAWDEPRLLVDMLGVTTLRGFTDQFSLGVAVSSRLPHLRIASIVPPDRVTRTTEKAAVRGGAALKVFSSEVEALVWLLHPGG